MTARFTAQPATPDSHLLGEGPLWDPDRQRLLWVDIEPGVVHEGHLDTAAGTIKITEKQTFGTTVGAVAVTAGGDLILAERRTLARIEAGTGARTQLARVLPEDRVSRLNDGAVDPAGRFLVGSMAQDDRTGQEVLVRLDGAEITVLDDDLDLSNGLAWSPDGTRLYSVDTGTGTIWARDYDPATGATGPREKAFSVTDGHPDGMCADAGGNLWIAVYGGGRVECRTPTGELLAVVEVGAPNTTCPAFAGPDLDVLVISTARQGMSDADLAEHPHAGKLFTARVGVTGMTTPYWQP